jgi:malate dehydrogenase (oxaloacetate-decarboxylating)
VSPASQVRAFAPSHRHLRLIAGIDPSKTLSVTLDVGTNNKELLKDPLYVVCIGVPFLQNSILVAYSLSQGWSHERVRGERYDAFADKFVQLVRKHHPHCLLHFEDFGVENAHRLLDRYKDQHAVFNDDIQGTGAVTLACLMAAVGVTKTKLSDQRYIIFGAGSAGLGIACQIRDAILAIDADSETRESANSKFYLIDRHGLIRRSLNPEMIRKDLEEFVRPDEEWEGIPVNEDGEIELLEVVKHVKPTVLIGCSTKAGAFDERVVKAMHSSCDRPIILPLSNPSKLVEVTPQDANDWTDGKVLIATGSPFPSLKMPNGKDYVVAECNSSSSFSSLSNPFWSTFLDFSRTS